MREEGKDEDEEEMPKMLNVWCGVDGRGIPWKAGLSGII